MGIISRPVKQGGVTTYVAKVGLAFTKILDTEADADLDTIYAAWNAGADTVNLKDGAVTNPKLATDAVTDVKVAAAAAIQGSKLLDNSVDGLKLKNSPNGVPLAKMNVGATLRTYNSAAPAPGNFAGDGVERDVVTLPSITVSGVNALVVVGGTLGMYVLAAGPSVEREVRWRLFGGTAGTTLLGTWSYGVNGSWVGPVPTPLYMSASLTGAQIFRLAITFGGAGVAGIVHASGPGVLHAASFA